MSPEFIITFCFYQHPCRLKTVWVRGSTVQWCKMKIIDISPQILERPVVKQPDIQIFVQKKVECKGKEIILFHNSAWDCFITIMTSCRNLDVMNTILHPQRITPTCVLIFRTDPLKLIWRFSMQSQLFCKLHLIIALSRRVQPRYTNTKCTVACVAHCVIKHLPNTGHRVCKLDYSSANQRYFNNILTAAIKTWNCVLTVAIETCEKSRPQPPAALHNQNQWKMLHTTSSCLHQGGRWDILSLSFEHGMHTLFLWNQACVWDISYCINDREVK